MDDLERLRALLASTPKPECAAIIVMFVLKVGLAFVAAGMLIRHRR